MVTWLKSKYAQDTIVGYVKQIHLSDWTGQLLLASTYKLISPQIVIN